MKNQDPEAEKLQKELRDILKESDEKARELFERLDRNRADSPEKSPQTVRRQKDEKS